MTARSSLKQGLAVTNTDGIFVMACFKWSLNFSAMKEYYDLEYGLDRRVTFKASDDPKSNYFKWIVK